MTISWFKYFQKEMNIIFTQEDTQKYNELVKHYLSKFQKYLKPDAKILETGCGLGRTAIPLSIDGYKVTGIDNDKKVIEAAKKNAEKFGKNIKIVYGDIFNIDKIFEKDSSDACISTGVLEHFSKAQIKKLVNKQLYIAPIVILEVQTSTYKDISIEYEDYKKVIKNIPYTNFWTSDYWLNNILKGYNILQYNIGKAPKIIGGFNDLLVVIGRKHNPHPI